MLVYLMGIEQPLPQIAASIEAGIDRFKAKALKDKAWVKGPPVNRLVDKPGARHRPHPV